LKIPYRETENGFEAQETYVGQIRNLEKEFKPTKSPQREELREHIDKFLMQSKSFDELLLRLQNYGYEIKQGKYISVKPRLGGSFIRLKSLGENYSEQALRNRITNKHNFEKAIDKQIQSKVTNVDNPKSALLEIAVLKTVKQYTITFATDVLPMRKKNKKKYFAWTNDSELDKLSELNKKLNKGANLISLQNDFAVLENVVTENENKIVKLKSELKFFTELYKAGERCFASENVGSYKDLAFLNENKITAENYRRIEKLIIDSQFEIADLEKSLLPERENLKNAADILATCEKISGGTYVQTLIEEERERRQSKLLKMNGIKPAQ
jgi:hypothetical protein